MRAEELKRLARHALASEGEQARLRLVVRGKCIPPAKRQLWRGGPRAQAVDLCGEGIVIEIGARQILEALDQQDILFVDADASSQAR